MKLKIVILGLSITSSWGNGHATTYRGLVRELAYLGNEILFLERDVPWYAKARDLPHPPYCRTELYSSLDELKKHFGREIAAADVVVVGSYVPDGVSVGEWVVQSARGLTAFYDIDTPVTLSMMEQGEYRYLSPALIARYRLYLSFTGGPILDRIRSRYGAPVARALYCSIDPSEYFPERRSPHWDLSYMGTYSSDRQPALEKFMIQPALRRPDFSMAVAGPKYPADLLWPSNIQRIEHLPPSCHRRFYNEQRFALNITRAAMVEAGYSPSVRLFEAAACGRPIISDNWPGLEEFFTPGKDILIANTSRDVLEYLDGLSAAELASLGESARRRVVSNHTPAHRAAEFESILSSV